MRSANSRSPDKLPAWRTLPTSIWALGFGSFFMDMSSELIHSLLPLFMVTTLGASMVTVGIIEGIAEATAAIVKVFSGVLSDFLKKRKFLVITGYSLAMLTKPVFPLATSLNWVFTARFIDRVGKGIRGAPRDALIADTVSADQRGAAYGLRQALDSLGALAGPLLAVGLMILFLNDIRAVMWAAIVPAVIAVALLVVYVHEPKSPAASQSVSTPLHFTDARRLPVRYWLVVLSGAIFTLARFSEAFLILRAQDTGFELSFIPLVMIVMNVFYAGVAYPAGAASDRISHRQLLLAGLIILIVADIVLAYAATISVVFAGAALWGLHMALTQGLLSKLVADTVPADLRGTGFGLFNLVTGGALLLASVIAGVLWNSYGPAATFLTGAGFAVISALGILFSFLFIQKTQR